MSHEPLSEAATVHMAGSYFREYLHGTLTLCFWKGNPVDEDDNPLGTIRLQTPGGVAFLFTITNVRHDQFKKLAQEFKMNEVNKNQFEGKFHV